MSGFIRLSDLRGLGQTTNVTVPAAPPAPKVGFWSQKVDALQTPLSNTDWNLLGSMAMALVVQANTAQATPVATAAQSIVTATQAAVAGTGSAAIVQTAVANLVQAAQFEDNATNMDRDVAEQIINQQIFQLSSDVSAWNTKHSGLYALWDKARGGADTSSIDPEFQQIQDTINTTPLTILGRKQLQDQFTRVKGSLNTSLDWGTISIAVGSVAGIAALQWGLPKVQALAAKHATKHLSRTDFGKKFGIKGEEEDEG